MIKPGALTADVKTEKAAYRLYVWPKGESVRLYRLTPGLLFVRKELVLTRNRTAFEREAAQSGVRLLSYGALYDMARFAAASYEQGTPPADDGMHRPPHVRLSGGGQEDTA